MYINMCMVYRYVCKYVVYMYSYHLYMVCMYVRAHVCVSVVRYPHVHKCIWGCALLEWPEYGHRRFPQLLPTLLLLLLRKVSSLHPESVILLRLSS